MSPLEARLHDVIRRRRDVRREFTGAPVDDDALQRVLEAAHAAPSVGLSQPWDFIRIDSRRLRDEFRCHVEEERRAFDATLDADASATFRRIKVEGIREATLGLVVTYDPTRGGPHVLGRHAIADAGLYSVCLAIQNLWLAATAEGWGVGWVSFYREAFLSRLVGLPEHVRPVAWLCIGPVTHLDEVPDLERAGWRTRRPLAEALHVDRWGGPYAPVMADELDDEALAFARRIFDLAREGMAEELGTYLAAGVPPNMTNEKGDTLLMLAAYNKHPATVQVLLEHGADTARINDRGQTALGAAVFRRSAEAVGTLLAHGADPTVGSPSAVEVAAFFDLPDMAALLAPEPPAT